LIVSDDPEFARSVAARWQTERTAPEITLATSDIWRAASASNHDLVILGVVPSDIRSSILSVLGESINKPAIYVTADEAETFALHASYPQLLVLERRDEWIGTLILLANEILRRVEALNRAHRAEHLALESQRYATLGRYMLDVRPSINDALTSVLGNADLLLLEPAQTLEKAREQIKTIHRMSLRLNEIMQRFSSLASEIITAADESPLEPVSASQAPAFNPPPTN
jgi:signal transduction histidine kinase